MPTIKDPFATPEELSIKSNGAISATHPDAARELEAASERIRNYCRWHVWPQVVHTLRLNGPGTDQLFLPTLYLQSITSMTDAGTAVDVAGLDYNTGERSDGIVDGHKWTARRGQVVAVIVHGHPDMPSTLKDVAMHVAARALGSPLGATKEAAGGVSVSWSLTGSQVAGGTVLLDSEHDALDTYRLPGRT